MGLLYLFSLIVGLGVLLVQVAMGGKGDGDGGHGDADAGHGDALAAHGAGKALTKEVVSGATEVIAFFTSLRFWIFTLLGFGLSGTLLHFFSLAGPFAAAILALLTGLCSGLFATWALRFAAHPPATATAADVTQARGRIGRVLVPCAKGKVGKIRVELKGQSVDLLAITSEGEITRGEHVLVIDFEGDVARVERRPPELA